MKKVFSIFLVCFFLFMLSAPIFASAAVVDPGFIVNSPLAESYVLNIADLYLFGCYVAVSQDSAYWQGIKIEGDYNTENCRAYYSSNYGRVALKGYATGTAGDQITFVYSSINLITGKLTTTKNKATFNSNGVAEYNRVLSPAEWDGVLCYLWNLSNKSIVYNGTILQSAYNYVTYKKPIAAEYVINSYIPEPKADYSHFYLADSLYLYAIFIDNEALYNYKGRITNGAYWDQYQLDAFIPYLSKVNDTTVKVQFTNNTVDDINIYVSKYDLRSGTFVSVSTNSVTSESVAYISFTIASDNNHSIWYDGLVNSDGLAGFSRMSIRWSDTIDYSSDFLSLTSFLDNWYETLGTSLTNIDTDLDSVISNQIILKQLVENFNTWFQNTFWGDSDYAPTYNSIRDYLDVYAFGWSYLQNMIANRIVPSLNKIVDLLGGNDEMEDTSSFEDTISEYDDNEHAVISYAAGALDEAASYINDAGDVLTINSNGLLFIKQIFEQFAFTGLNYYFMLFVLVLGCVALLIGRRLR